jgi:hypothetical protein
MQGEAVMTLKPGRLLEWEHAVIMMMIGLVLLLPTKTFSSDLFTPFREMAPEYLWGLMFVAVGLVRCIALWLNGRMPIGSPIARMIGIASTMAMLGFVAGVFVSAGPSGYWAASVYAVMVTFEARTMFNATRDFRNAVYS